MSLQVAQNTCGFVHWDLTPWNIVLEEHDKEITIDYKVNASTVVTIHTKITAVIIDYGKSHVIHDKIHHHGFVNPNVMSTVQDIVTLIMTTSKILLKKHVSTTTFKFMVFLVNFMSNTTYLQYPVKNAKSIKSFTRLHSTYSDMTSNNKGSLENKTPFDLYQYVSRFRL